MAELDEIVNYMKLSERVGTAGQPTEDQLSAIRDAGYECVINLAMPTSTGALPEERERVEAMGMEYVALPVEWEAPTPHDVFRFFNAMEERHDRKLFVHCAMNMRVSAFMYLYRTLKEGMTPEEARRDMDRIWQPNATWQALIQEVMEIPSP